MYPLKTDNFLKNQSNFYYSVKLRTSTIKLSIISHQFVLCMMCEEVPEYTAKESFSGFFLLSNRLPLSAAGESRLEARKELGEEERRKKGRKGETGEEEKKRGEGAPFQRHAGRD